MEATAILSPIGRTLRTVSGETVAGISLGATVFCMVLGSSSVPELVGPGRKLRWVALFVLAAVAVVLAVRERRTAVARPLLVVSALGLWLVALGLVSVLWSVTPSLSFGRAGSFAVLIVAAIALALAVRGRPNLTDRLLYGVLGGTMAAVVAGAVLLLFAYGEAVQPASTQFPDRYKGLGENPDTVSMLEGIALPLALWAFVSARTRSRRALALGTAVLLVAAISGSGSRGGLVAALAGGVVFSVALRTSVRRRLGLALAVVIAVLGGTAATQIPKPLGVARQTGGGSAQPSVPPGTPAGGSGVDYSGRLADELYRIETGQRSLLTSSGRLQAWVEGIHQGDERPLLGYGFGTEDKVFVDRVYGFNGGHVENSFIGFYLQLGAVGLASFVALLLAICVAAFRGVRRAPAGLASHGAPVAGVLAAGMALMLVQSYAYAVGNVATVAFWTTGFMAASLALASGSRRADVRAPDEGGHVVAP